MDWRPDEAASATMRGLAPPGACPDDLPLTLRTARVFQTFDEIKAIML